MSNDPIEQRRARFRGLRNAIVNGTVDDDLRGSNGGGISLDAVDRATVLEALRVLTEGADAFRELHTAAREVASLVGPLCDAFALGELDPEHTVNVLQPDGSTRVECSHTFPGTSRCAHCGVPAVVLKARDRVRALSLKLDELAGAFES